MTDPNLTERDARVLELRRAGATFEAIAAALGLASKQVAHQAFQRALAAQPPEDHTEARTTEVDRLDRLQTRIWSAAMQGDLGAVDRVLKIIERRSKLLGLDVAPVAAPPAADESVVDALAARRARRLGEVTEPSPRP